MKVNCTADLSRSDWDDSLRTAGPNAGFLQSTLWARLIVALDRALPLFLEVKNEEGRPLLSLLALRKGTWSRETKAAPTLFEFWRRKKWLESFDGPVFQVKDLATSSSALNTILEWIDNYCSHNGISRVFFSGLPIQSEFLSTNEIHQIFLSRKYRANLWATYLVDLSVPEDELLKNVDHSVRKNLKKAAVLGVTIRQALTFEEFFEGFIKPYSGLTAQNGKVSVPLWTAKPLWEEDRSRNYRYYIAESAAGELYGLLGMTIFNGVATEVSSALSPLAYERKIPAQDLLHWQMLLDAKKLGCHTFNLAGVNPSPSDPKEQGIRRFKEKWGGRYVEYFSYEKLLPTSLERVLTMVRKLFK